MSQNSTLLLPDLNLSLREESLRRKAAGSLSRFDRARRSLAGGVSTGLRRSAKPFPLYFRGGSGPYLEDVDGNKYVDYMLGWGPLILGHAPQAVTQEITKHLALGYTFGGQHDLEFEVAEALQRCVPCADRVVFANSGTEIVQVALRLARACTSRQKYLKFEGHYHGWDDSVLVSYHPSEAQIEHSHGRPIPVGEGQRSNSDAIVVEWNDRAGVEQAFRQHGSELCAVLCEPLLCNSGCIPPAPGFLEFLRSITSAHRTLLIFDEVITGFRLALGGAQQYYGVVPDLATFAKAVGGGLPLSVLAGKAEFMEKIASGEVVHAGTLNGNPVVLAAAKATIAVLSARDARVYSEMWSLGDDLKQGLLGRLAGKKIPVVATGGGPVFQIHIQENAPRTYRESLASNRGFYVDFAVAMLDEGVILLQDGRWYVSAAHTGDEISRTLEAVDRVLG
ncbi:MAG TPA: aspartate aminotransferase family protein [Acidobacteriaceae bacterium]|nr:aspartate aminotransferase family protein [Acidobacteriaceae bacterium]